MVHVERQTEPDRSHHGEYMESYSKMGDPVHQTVLPAAA